jgi:hypothetical protein
MSPTAEQMVLPSGYGTPKEKLEWVSVNQMLVDAPQYWVASVPPDGRPHVVPRDGMWIDDPWYYGGGEDTIHNRNLRYRRLLTMHIGDGLEAVIVEGEARQLTPTQDLGAGLGAAQRPRRRHPEEALDSASFVNVPRQAGMLFYARRAAGPPRGRSEPPGTGRTPPRSSRVGSR